MWLWSRSRTTVDGGSGTGTRLTAEQLTTTTVDSAEHRHDVGQTAAGDAASTTTFHATSRRTNVSAGTSVSLHGRRASYMTAAGDLTAAVSTQRNSLYNDCIAMILVHHHVVEKQSKQQPSSVNRIKLEYLAVYSHASMAAFRQLSTHIVPPRSKMCERRD